MRNMGLIVQYLGIAGVALCCACAGCSKRTDEKAAAQAQQEAPPPPPPPPPSQTTAPAAAEVPVPGPGAVEAKASGTLSVTPDPVPVCDKTGTGVGTVSWTVQGATYVEVRLDKPDGTLFAASNKPTSSQKTGPWLRKDLVLFLQDADNNHPRDANYTLAKLTVPVTGGGPCP
jgi:hypothetical protein